MAAVEQVILLRKKRQTAFERVQTLEETLAAVDSTEDEVVYAELHVADSRKAYKKAKAEDKFTLVVDAK